MSFVSDFLSDSSSRRTDWQERTRLLIKDRGIQTLANAHVFVAGLGGVGAYAAEMLCRAGLGTITIADADMVSATNRNRQLLALLSTEGRRKVNLMKDRLLDINPDIVVNAIDTYLRDEFTDMVLETPFDYVVDAIDTLSPKIFLINRTVKNGLPLVSSMGAGGKLDPMQVQVTDFSETYNCKLARILRKRLKRLGVSEGFKAVFSSEPTEDDSMEALLGEPNKKTTVGTISYMPAIFGCVCASVAIRGILGTN